MTPVARRADLVELVGYHSPQVTAEVRLNTNESPFPPPAAWLEALAEGVRSIPFNRYPDRGARELRQALAAFHGVDVSRVFCAKGSNEILQCLLLAYGGPGRSAATFEPTYQLHGHIASITGTAVHSCARTADFALDLDAADRLLAAVQPTITFLCSPNNPTGTAEPVSTVRHLLGEVPGLLVVDEAYGQFADSSALELVDGRTGAAGVEERLVVVRTFSKTWSMAACRLGYLIASPDVVEACEAVALPYHLDAVAQLAGLLALQHVAAMEERVAVAKAERERLVAGLGSMAVATWPSQANFVLFRPLGREAKAVWHELLDASVLVRDCSSWPGLEGCLRVTVGSDVENDRFLEALGPILEKGTPR